jgi:hypothetical protein
MSGASQLLPTMLRSAAPLLYLFYAANFALAAETPASFAGKTIRVVVPVAPGGGLDLQSRALAFANLLAGARGDSERHDSGLARRGESSDHVFGL